MLFRRSLSSHINAIQLLLFCFRVWNPENVRAGLLSSSLGPEISPIFINRTDARRHVANRSTKCVIAFGFNTRPRERRHTRHPANRILHVNSRMDGHRGSSESRCGGGGVVWDTRFTFWNPRRQWGTTSAIVINVIDLVRSALALLPPLSPSPNFRQPLRSSVATLYCSFPLYPHLSSTTNRSHAVDVVRV